jgi:hypothetical protein
VPAEGAESVKGLAIQSFSWCHFWFLISYPFLVPGCSCSFLSFPLAKGVNISSRPVLLMGVFMLSNDQAGSLASLAQVLSILIRFPYYKLPISTHYHTGVPA